MNARLFKLISSISHPVVIFPLLMAVYFEWEYISSFFAVLLLSFLLPFIYFLYLAKRGEVSDFDVTKREERYKIFYAALIGLVCSIIYLFIFSSREIFFDFGILLMLAVVLIIANFKIKVSIHTALITVLCFSFYTDFNFHPAIFLLIPIVAYARLKLKRHKFYELLLGFLIPALFLIW